MFWVDRFCVQSAAGHLVCFVISSLCKRRVEGEKQICQNRDCSGFQHPTTVETSFDLLLVLSDHTGSMTCRISGHEAETLLACSVSSCTAVVSEPGACMDSCCSIIFTAWRVLVNGRGSYTGNEVEAATWMGKSLFTGRPTYCTLVRSSSCLSISYGVANITVSCTTTWCIYFNVSIGICFSNKNHTFSSSAQLLSCRTIGYENDSRKTFLSWLCLAHEKNVVLYILIEWTNNQCTWTVCVQTCDCMYRPALEKTKVWTFEANSNLFPWQLLFISTPNMAMAAVAGFTLVDFSVPSRDAPMVHPVADAPTHALSYGVRLIMISLA